MFTEVYYPEVDYKIGDEIVSKHDPMKIIGKCTGFINDQYVEIDNDGIGYKQEFMKSEWVECEIIN